VQIEKKCAQQAVTVCLNTTQQEKCNLIDPLSTYKRILITYLDLKETLDKDVMITATMQRKIQKRLVSRRMDSG